MDATSDGGHTGSVASQHRLAEGRAKSIADEDKDEEREQEDGEARDRTDTTLASNSNMMDERSSFSLPFCCNLSDREQ